MAFAESAGAFPRLPWRRAGHNPVHRTAAIGDAAKLADMIRENPAIANAADPNGNTPLHLSAAYNRTEAADILVRSGADINAKNAEGMTPLTIAAKSGSVEVTKLLLRHHADTTIKDARGCTALKWAKRNQHYEIAVRIILAASRR